jgi:hypothetical protein
MGTTTGEALSLNEVESLIQEMKWGLSTLDGVTDPEYGSDFDRCAIIVEVMAVLTEHTAFKSAVAEISRRSAG